MSLTPLAYLEMMASGGDSVIVVTPEEAETMIRMDGGVCLENWMFLRGLDIQGHWLPPVDDSRQN